jgi:putative transcriptional regulator
VYRLAKLREEKGLTQRRVAEALGVDISTVRNWEKGRGGAVMFQKVAKLCDLLSCRPQDLYEEEEELRQKLGNRAANCRHSATK